MDYSMPGLSVHHQLPEFTQTQVHSVGDAIQPSHPLSSPFPPSFNLSQHQGLSKWLSSSHQVAKVLEFQFQHQSFQWILISFRMDRLDLLAVQRTPKSLLQHRSLKASILQWHGEWGMRVGEQEMIVNNSALAATWNANSLVNLRRQNVTVLCDR